MRSRASLTVAVLARDEGSMIEECLRRLSFADRVLVGVDDRTVDDTAARAEHSGADVMSISPAGFATMRNQLLAEVETDYVLLVDADERVGSSLRDEILSALAAPEPAAAYRVRIANWFYGHRVRRSGYRERPIRLVPTELATFAGDIHERPKLGDEVVVRQFRSPLVHLSHRSISDNLAKTAGYAEVQARELLHSGHARVSRLTLVKVIGLRLIRHIIIGQGFRDGTAGFVESMYQAFSHFCVYVRLWELQQDPSIDDRYRAIENELR